MDTKERIRSFLVRHRIYVNRFVIVLIAVLIAHPRNRFFFSLGFLTALVGALVRVWARGTMPAGSQELQTSGPYRFVRHPMYLGTALEAAGVWIACASFSWAFTFLFLGILMLSYFLFVYKEAILIEEETLYGRFRNEWLKYAKEVPAFAPHREALRAWVKEELASFHWDRFEHSKEWRNFIAFLGVFVFLWFKLVYRL